MATESTTRKSLPWLVVAGIGVVLAAVWLVNSAVSAPHGQPGQAPAAPVTSERVFVGPIGTDTAGFGSYAPATTR
jgi:hypothetical protein